MESLEQLFGAEEQHATFHDAKIEDITYNEVDRAARVTARLWVGDPGAVSSAARERRRGGVLELRRISAWRDERPSGVGSWLADDGPIAQAPSHEAQELSRQLRNGEIGWYFFFADSNSFLYWVAAEASFRWAHI